MDIHHGAKIYFNNKLTHYGKSNMVWYYRGEITVYHPLCSHAQREKVREGEKGNEERLSDGLFGSEGAWLISRPPVSAGRWTGTCHLECEAAGVILRDTVRWSGWPCLRSAQLLLPLIFNRCLGARPAKSSHMPEQGNQSKDPAAGWAPWLTHTHTQLLEGAHTQTALCVLNHCH